MPRHRRDSNYHLLPRKYPVVTVDKNLAHNTTIVVNDSSTLTNATSTTVETFEATVYTYTNGNIRVGTHKLGKAFTFATWVKVSSATRYTLLNISNKFNLILDTSTNTIILRRVLYGSTYEEISIPCTVALDTWTHIAVVRQYNIVTVVKNLVQVGQITNYYYDIASANTYFGTAFTGQLANTVLYLKQHNFPGICNSLATLKKTRNQLTSTTENAESKLLDLHEQELVSSSDIYPIVRTNTFYDADANCWLISRANTTANFRTGLNGLTIVPPFNGLHNGVNVKTSYPLTVELGFSISANTNIVVASQWYSANNRSWFLWYEVSTGYLWFVYLNKSNNTINSVLLGSYVSGEINFVAFTATKTTLVLYFNGKLIQTLTMSLVKLHQYRFNYDNSLVTSTGSNFELHTFTVSKLVKYTADYLPYKSTKAYKYIPVKAQMYEYHYNDEPRRNKRKGINTFQITGSDTITPNSTNTYTVTLRGRARNATVINLTLKLGDKTDLISNDVTFPATVTVAANSTTATFTVTLNNYAVNPYKDKFSIVGKTHNSSARKDITITDSRTLALSAISSINGYLDGYLTQQSVSAGSIPNIANTATATTSASRVDTLHGVGYTVQSTADAINFTEQTNVRTAILLYRELIDTPTRGYFGDADTYTFNGGTSQQLVGSLVFNTGEYIKALSLVNKAFVVAIAENDSAFVIVDEANYKVLVYERVNSVWSSSATELNLGLSDNTEVLNASVDINTTGTVIALGFPNGSNGEGVVQVWRKVSNIWTKDLHVGSPFPNPYKGALGHSVAINDAGTRLFANEVDSNNVYVYEKNTLWSATPAATINGANRFGHQISCNSAGTKLYVNEVDTSTSYIYTLNTTWGLSQTIEFGINGKLNKAGNFLVLSEYTTGIVKVYDYATTFTEIETIIGETDFGYSLAVNNAKDVLIGSPSDHTIHHYKAENVYTVSTDYVSTSLQNTDYYGYTCALSINSLVVSNFFSTVELITSDGTSIPQNIFAVRQNYATANISDTLVNIEPQILTFYSNTPLVVSTIGNTKSSLSLNGIVYGHLLFNRILTSTEVTNIENLLRKYLSWNTYSLYL